MSIKAKNRKHMYVIYTSDEHEVSQKQQKRTNCLNQCNYCSIIRSRKRYGNINRAHNEHYYAYPIYTKRKHSMLIDVENKLTVIGPMVPVGVAVIYAVSG